MNHLICSGKSYKCQGCGHSKEHEIDVNTDCREPSECRFHGCTVQCSEAKAEVPKRDVEDMQLETQHILEYLHDNYMTGPRYTKTQEDAVRLRETLKHIRLSD